MENHDYATLLVIEMSIPTFTRTFTGSSDDDAESWLIKFNAWAQYQNIHNNGHRYGGAFRMALEGQAEVWFDALPNATQTNVQALNASFTNAFINVPIPWHLERELLKRCLEKNERFDAYLNDIVKLCRRLRKTDGETMHSFMRGLPPRIQSGVIQREPATLQEAVQAAKLALEAQRITDDTTIEATTDSMAAMLTGAISELREALNVTRATNTSASRPMQLHHANVNVTGSLHDNRTAMGLCGCSSCTGPMTATYEDGYQRQQPVTHNHVPSHHALGMIPQHNGHGTCCEQLLSTVAALTSARNPQRDDNNDDMRRCQLCKKRGHEAISCYRLQSYATLRFPSTVTAPIAAPSVRQSTVPFTIAQCFRCGKQHRGRCRFETTQCRRCLQIGHFERCCSAAPPQQPPQA